MAARVLQLGLIGHLLVHVKPWAVEDPEEFPNLLAGSFTDGQKFSTGNTLPLVGRPWGFNHFSPQTNDGRGAWWFRGDSVEFRWLRLTHQPSPWIGDWCWVNFGPQMGNLEQNPVMFFEPWGSRIKPFVFDAMLGPDNMRVQLTPTMHAAILKVTFPSNNPMGYAKRICFKLPTDDAKGRKKSGTLGGHNGDDMWLELLSSRAEEAPANFGFYLHAEVDKSSLQYRVEGEKVTTQQTVRCFNFSPKESAVTVRIGTSLISYAQARLNLWHEVGGHTFEEVELDGKMLWREMLGRVRVEDPGPLTKPVVDRLTIFYTCLYRALTFPRRLDEVDENGKIVHSSPYKSSGGVFDGPLATDTGFWDTYRTVYPLLNLVYPKESGEIIQGWLNAFREGGWLPEWASPGYRVCMVGTFADVAVADAVVKNIPGFDKALAWQALSKDSFQAGDAGGHAGKKHYGDYVNKGFVPVESNGDAASATLDFAFSDYAVSFAAEKLDHGSEAQQLRKRATNARDLLFDHRWGLMRAKKVNGEFRMDNPVSWGNGFVEGASWQHSFPPFDLAGLSRLHGSYEALSRKILQMLTTPGTFQPGSYRRVIHEMEEMRALGMGQYAHSNQPVHHILWLLLALDEGRHACDADAPEPGPGVHCPRRAGESAIHDALTRAYSPLFFAGDEDNGEMGAWYVLGALGLFDPAPGTPHGYALGSPLFRKVEIRREAGDRPADLTILNGRAGGMEVAHVSRVVLNGRDVGGPASADRLGWTLSYDELFAKPNGKLRFITSGERLEDPLPEAGIPSAAVPNPAPVYRKLEPPATERPRIAEVAAGAPAPCPSCDPCPKQEPRVACPDVEALQDEVAAKAGRVQALELQLSQQSGRDSSTTDDIGHLEQVCSFMLVVAVNNMLWCLTTWGFCRSLNCCGRERSGNGSHSAGAQSGRRIKYASRTKVGAASKKDGMNV
mmetsp:Transcript_3551/g.8867  ORF Transcript_3551/g.8867 Transcript_3551/m.8867 type:complete len:952 (-) Transcript_3551:2-2857(-)